MKFYEPKQGKVSEFQEKFFLTKSLMPVRIVGDFFLVDLLVTHRLENSLISIKSNKNKLQEGQNTSKNVGICD